MPLYDFDCPACGTQKDIVAHPDEREMSCPVCTATMTRLFPTSWGTIPDIEPYVDENMGKDPIYIRSRRHKKEMLREKGLVMLG